MNSFEKAEDLRAHSRFKQAEKIYRRILKVKKISVAEKAQALLGLGDVERIQGKFKEALLHYQTAHPLLKSQDPFFSMDAEVGWALAARAVGRPQEALQNLAKALGFYKKTGDRQGTAFTHWALGGTLRIAGKMNPGLKELQTALRLFRKLKDAEGVAYTCCALGGIHRMLGQYELSGKFYREANRRMRQRGDTFGIAYSYCGLGNVERMAGRYRKALPFYRKAEKLYGSIGDQVSYAYTLWSIGTAYKMQGLYTQAHWAFYKADSLFKKTGDTRGRIYTLLGFAECEWLKGHGSKGNAYWKQAKLIADRSDFAWENLHVEALKDGRVKNLSVHYKKAGSKFQPEALPVNWP